MPVIRAAKGVWCDYCKTRFPKEHINHAKPASWTVISESEQNKGKNRNYCQACSEEVCLWDGMFVWELQDQVNYTMKRNGEQLNV